MRANANGSIIRLKDVARVSLEASSYNTESGINGENAAVLGIYMLPGANAMEVAERDVYKRQGMYTNGATNAGFNFSIPLPGKKRRRHLLQVMLPEYFAFQYDICLLYTSRCV